MSETLDDFSLNFEQTPTKKLHGRRGSRISPEEKWRRKQIKSQRRIEKRSRKRIRR